MRKHASLYVFLRYMWKPSKNQGLGVNIFKYNARLGTWLYLLEYAAMLFLSHDILNSINMEVGNGNKKRAEGRERPAVSHDVDKA